MKKIQTRMIDGERRRVIELAGDMRISNAEMIRLARFNKHLCGGLVGNSINGAPLAAETQAYFDKVIAGYSDAESIKQRDALLAGAKTDPTLRSQLAGMRLESFSNFLLAPALWVGQFGEIVNLADADRPVAQRFTKQEVAVTSVGADGEPNTVKINFETDETLVPMEYITTDIVRYRSVDVYRGSVTDPALATIKLATDMGNRINWMMQQLLKGPSSTFFGNFVFTDAKRVNWPYVANSYINTANLPTSNDITVLNDSGVAVDKFGFYVLDAIVDYCARWRGAFEDGIDIKPTGKILLPPGHIKEIRTGIYPSGAKPTNIAEELMAQGWFGVNYLGVNWVFEPDTTLDPDDRICYPEFNKKPARVYFKPGLDREGDSSGNYDHEKKNEVERYMQRVVGMYYDSSTRPYAARFNYGGA